MEPGKEPCDWKVEKFANIDGDEKFIRDMCELKTIVNASMIEGQQREEVNNAVALILFDGLMPTFNQLQKIRVAHGNELPIMDRQELYHDFYRKLWKSYKDLTQRAATEMGFNIGFLFKDNNDFKNGLPIFIKNHPQLRPEVGNALQDARSRWQNELATFRNTFIEHQNSDQKLYAKFYDLKFAERIFEEVWNTIVDLLALLLETKLTHGTRLALPDPKTMPNWKNRFVFGVPAFRNRK